MDNHTIEADSMTVEETTTFSTFLTTPNWYFTIKLPNRGIFVSSVCLSLAVLPGNLLTILVFVFDRAVRKPINYLIVNQSVVDILMAMYFIASAFFNHEPSGVEILSQNKTACLIIPIGFNFLVTSSSLNILAISLQRLVFVIKPHAPKSRRLAPVTLVGVFMEYAVMATLFSVGLFGRKAWYPGMICNLISIYSPVYTTTMSLLPVTLMTCIVMSNVFICIRYKKQRALVLASDASSQQTKQWKVTMMLVLVAGLFVTSWVPLFVTVTVLLQRRLIDSDSQGNMFPVLEIEVAKLFLLINGIVNPLIYAAKIPAFKTTFKKIFGLKI